MKAKEADKLSAIRMLQAAVKNREIELRPNAITEQDVMGVVKKLAKQRKDSITEFEKAGRNDLVEKEKYELGVLEAYLGANERGPDRPNRGRSDQSAGRDLAETNGRGHQGSHG